MLIYRIEHPKSGKGPYQHGTSRHRASLYHPNNILLKERVYSRDRHPTPRECGVKIPRSYRCGFTSKKAMQSWFGRIIPDLLSMGYEIKRYEVERHYVVKINRQCLFNYNRAIPVE